MNVSLFLSHQNTVIDPQNEMSYTMWRDVPVPFFMSVYFFHVLNPKEILSGEKPMLEQRGPYVYRYKKAQPLETLSSTTGFGILTETVQMSALQITYLCISHQFMLLFLLYCLPKSQILLTNLLKYTHTTVQLAQNILR